MKISFEAVAALLQNVLANYFILPEGHCLHGIYESFLNLTDFTCFPLNISNNDENLMKKII